MADTGCRLIYITAPDREVALALARAVVEQRLAACANVLGTISSVYWWEGRVNSDDEVAVILKTAAGLVEPLIARLKELHPYSCPCVVALPIEAGNAAFLQWIRDETA